MATFQSGDVVYLKSGSPSLTVSNQQSDDIILVTWFVDGEVKTTQLHPGQLTKENPNPKQAPAVAQRNPRP